MEHPPYDKDSVGLIDRIRESERCVHNLVHSYLHGYNDGWRDCSSNLAQLVWETQLIEPEMTVVCLDCGRVVSIFPRCARVIDETSERPFCDCKGSSSKHLYVDTEDELL